MFQFLIVFFCAKCIEANCTELSTIQDQVSQLENVGTPSYNYREILEDLKATELTQKNLLDSTRKWLSQCKSKEEQVRLSKILGEMQRTFYHLSNEITFVKGILKSLLNMLSGIKINLHICGKTCFANTNSNCLDDIKSTLELTTAISEVQLIDADHCKQTAEFKKTIFKSRIENLRTGTNCK